MDFTLVLGFVFLVGTLVLLKSKHERHALVFFLIRTKYGMGLIDWVAGLWPRLWVFLADAASVVSFGGVGAAYLSKHKECKSNLYLMMFIVGLISVFSITTLGGEPALPYQVAVVLIMSLVFGVLSARRVHNHVVNLVVTSTLITPVVLNFLVFFGMNLSPALYVSVLTGVFGIPAVLVWGLLAQAWNILSGASNLPGVSPLLPSSQGGELGVSFPGYDIFIPWWHALIAISVTMVSHELAHGILMRVHRMKLKSTGLLTFGVLPVGAFVEPDEEELKARSSLEKMRVYSVGSMSNLIVGFASMLLLFSVILPFSSAAIKVDGLEVISVVDGTPAGETLRGGMIIYGINGRGVDSIAKFREITSTVKPGDEITLTTDEGVFKLTTIGDPEDETKPYIGIYFMEHITLVGVAGGLGFIKAHHLASIISSLSWIVFFNVNIALVNLLPVFPFDGGKMFGELIASLNVSKATVKRVVYAVIAGTSIIFAINMFPLIRMLVDYILNVFGLL